MTLKAEIVALEGASASPLQKVIVDKDWKQFDQAFRHQGTFKDLAFIKLTTHEELYYLQINPKKIALQNPRHE